MIREDTCILIASSDNTFDVFELVGPTVSRFWPLQRFACYVGLNARSAPAPFLTVRADVGGWARELRDQLRALPHRISRVILLLDDFCFLDHVPAERLERLVNLSIDRAMPYVRLKPVERSAPVAAFRFLRRGCSRGGDEVTELARAEPYYSSLQPAIWDRQHLVEMLTRCDSIWAFEHIVPPAGGHYAIERPMLRYRHLVEKGRWYRFSRRLLGRDGAKSFERRGFVDGWAKNSTLYNRGKFLILGYTVFRVRRALGRVYR